MTQRDFYYAFRLSLYTCIIGKCIEVPLLTNFHTFADIDRGQNMLVISTCHER